MIGENIKLLRKMCGMTQKQLGEAMGVSLKTISHWEKNYSEPSLEQLVRLKKIFNVDYADILEA